MHIVVCTLLCVLSAGAQRPLKIDSLRLARNGGLVQLSIDISLTGKDIASKRVIVLTPRLKGETDSVDFPQIVAYGRNAYYYDVRSGKMPLADADAFLIRYKDGPRTEHYARTVERKAWMDNSTLKLIQADGTPCDLTPVLETEYEGFKVPPPDTVIVERHGTEMAETTGTVSGQARIQFIVNRTEFVPELRNNKMELDSMLRSIRRVQADKRVKITKYKLKGYASPEGPYDNNVRLAKGRTERLREFVVDRWGVPEEQIEISYEPEDWKGFRDYMVEKHDSFPHADEIIAIIDTEMEPDPKLALIQKRYPVEYKKILKDNFPPLRRTDYSIEYEWVERFMREGKAEYDTIVRPALITDNDSLEDNVLTYRRPTRPWLALKTNLLGDLLLTPNVELEVPFGVDSRWSLMVEDWFPWFLHNKGSGMRLGKYIAPGSFMSTSSYELWTIGAELRYWFSPACRQLRPTLTGSFLGAYCASGKYDWEWDGSGDQGEFISAGITYGHSWVLSRCWNFELSATVGAVWGPRRHYNSQFGDTHLIWQYNDNIFYIGPTKLKASIVWLIPSLRKQKGGAHE